MEFPIGYFKNYWSLENLGFKVIRAFSEGKIFGFFHWGNKFKKCTKEQEKCLKNTLRKSPF